MASTLAPGELFTMDPWSHRRRRASPVAYWRARQPGTSRCSLLTWGELSEHTAPFDALALTLSGSLVLTIGGGDVRTAPQTIVLMPASVPHAVHATEASRMLLIMLREAP